MGIPRDVEEEIRGLQTEGRVKLRGIKLTGYSIKDGKPVKRPRKQSVSERIRQKKSKRVRPAKGPKL